MTTQNNPIVKTRGLIAAPFTPLDQYGELDLSIIPAYADWLQQENVAGAFICGTTGEGPSLTLQERFKVAEKWMETAAPDLRIIVHVGHNSLTDARALAKHAVSVNAHAIGCMPPQFFQPRNTEEVADCCTAVAEVAPELPFYYYHMPSMSGVFVEMAELIPVLAERIPNFTGVKFTYEDLEDYKKCLQIDNGRYDILFGRDEKLLSAIEAGATGAVGSTYNFAAPLYLKLFSAFDSGDLKAAKILQATAVRMIDVCITGSWHPIAGFKHIMEMIGVECGPTRLPIPRITSDEKIRLECLIKEISNSDLLHHYSPE